MTCSWSPCKKTKTRARSPGSKPGVSSPSTPRAWTTVWHSSSIPPHPNTSLHDNPKDGPCTLWEQKCDAGHAKERQETFMTRQHSPKWSGGILPPRESMPFWRLNIFTVPLAQELFSCWKNGKSPLQIIRKITSAGLIQRQRFF